MSDEKVVGLSQVQWFLERIQRKINLLINRLEEVDTICEEFDQHLETEACVPKNQTQKGEAEKDRDGPISLDAVMKAKRIWANLRSRGGFDDICTAIAADKETFKSIIDDWARIIGP